ncbi:hypothetical protein OIE52_08830 [Streptomyces canus]|uniref:hypothetical protein n=1 Tax=Streptomyces canus TaxID=58343 RepID=UPI0030E5F71C
MNNSSSRSRIHIAGLLALAIRTVNGGIPRPVPEPIATAVTPPTARSTPLPSADHHNEINRDNDDEFHPTERR